MCSMVNSDIRGGVITVHKRGVNDSWPWGFMMTGEQIGRCGSLGVQVWIRTEEHTNARLLRNHTDPGLLRWRLPRGQVLGTGAGALWHDPRQRLWGTSLAAVVSSAGATRYCGNQKTLYTQRDSVLMTLSESARASRVAERQQLRCRDGSVGDAMTAGRWSGESVCLPRGPGRCRSSVEDKGPLAEGWSVLLARQVVVVGETQAGCCHRGSEHATWRTVRWAGPSPPGGSVGWQAGCLVRGQRWLAVLQGG